MDPVAAVGLALRTRPLNAGNIGNALVAAALAGQILPAETLLLTSTAVDEPVQAMRLRRGFAGYMFERAVEREASPVLAVRQQGRAILQALATTRVLGPLVFSDISDLLASAVARHSGPLTLLYLRLALDPRYHQQVAHVAATIVGNGYLQIPGMPPVVLDAMRDVIRESRRRPDIDRP